MPSSPRTWGCSDFRPAQAASVVVVPTHVGVLRAGPPVEAVVLTVEETAELLKVGRTTIYDLVRDGQLGSIMIGRLRRIRYTDVITYLDQTAARGHRQ